jgi:imidazoleglycerol-phosphate dehydratase
MLTLFAKHAVDGFGIDCQGDLAVDGHHTVEDCGLALGQAFREALGGKEGIRRYGTGFRPPQSLERRSLRAHGRMPGPVRD